VLVRSTVHHIVALKCCSLIKRSPAPFVRATEFAWRYRQLGIKGVTLHNYR